MRAGFQTQTQNRAAQLASWGLRLGAPWFVLVFRKNEPVGQLEDVTRGKVLLMALCPLPSAATDSPHPPPFFHPSPVIFKHSYKTQQRNFVSPMEFSQTCMTRRFIYAKQSLMWILQSASGPSSCYSAVVANSKKHGQTLIFFKIKKSFLLYKKLLNISQVQNFI